MRLAYPAIFLFLPVMLSEGETSLDVLQSDSCKEMNLRFFSRDCGIRMTERLSASPAAAEDSAKQAARDLPAELAARRSLCAFNQL